MLPVLLCSGRAPPLLKAHRSTLEDGVAGDALEQLLCSFRSMEVRCIVSVASCCASARCKTHQDVWEALCGTGRRDACSPTGAFGLHAWGGSARRYFDYVNFNATGYRPYVTTLYAVLLGCARKTISRILVLIVSMGYGVVLPYLGAIQHKVGGPDSSLFLGTVVPYLSATQHNMVPK